jgi:hypothetical protein
VPHAPQRPGPTFGLLGRLQGPREISALGQRLRIKTQAGHDVDDVTVGFGLVRSSLERFDQGMGLLAQQRDPLPQKVFRLFANRWNEAFASLRLSENFDSVAVVSQDDHSRLLRFIPFVA